eukprot:283743-Chlamydomonas_euryale.AAC.1
MCAGAFAAEALERLSIPGGVEKLILKTTNTENAPPSRQLGAMSREFQRPVPLRPSPPSHSMPHMLPQLPRP